MPSTGKLYLVPVPIIEDGIQTLSPEVLQVTSALQYYFAENARTARRFLRSMHATLALEPIQISEIDKHTGPDTKQLRDWLKAGHSVGVMSESGCPGVADPGADLVRVAHEVKADIIPLTGPSSLLLALMASGLNGQCFCFNGYLPVKEPERGKRIKELEQISAQQSQTQLCIETPYRNNQLLDELLKHLAPGTRLCIAQNISAANAFIRTKTITDWKQHKPSLEKSPAVFLFLAH